MIQELNLTTESSNQLPNIASKTLKHHQADLILYFPALFHRGNFYKQKSTQPSHTTANI